MLKQVSAVCQSCGVEFTPKRRAQAYCSKRCRCRDGQRRHRAHRSVDIQTQQRGASALGLSQASQSRSEAPEAPVGASVGSKTPGNRFRWCGLALHVARRKKPVLTLVADADHPHLFRIRYPDGWTSTPANITRARDAAYGHARWLLEVVGE
jgi:hypothetical protein